jgi:hypothetical protein
MEGSHRSAPFAEDPASPREEEGARRGARDCGAGELRHRWTLAIGAPRWGMCLACRDVAQCE